MVRLCLLKCTTVTKDYYCIINTAGVSDKEPICLYRRPKGHKFNPWVGKIPWRRKWQLPLVFLSGKFHGQRSLANYSPRGCKESDMTGHTHRIHRIHLIHRIEYKENMVYIFFLYPFLCQWTFRLLPCLGYCK